jgi:hypothetical protein
MSNHAKTCKGFVEHYLGRPWTSADGLSEKDVKKAESRLGVTLPAALRTFYLSVGAVSELCCIHNTIFPPNDLSFEEGYLMFMDENQSVVSWGIKKKDLKMSDPEAWQRNNSSEDWYSEEKSFLELLTSMFEWYKQLGVWAPSNEKR